MAKEFKNMSALVKSLRVKHKLTQVEFRDLYSPTKKVQTVSNIERGVISLSVKYHKVIAEKLCEDISIFKEAYLKDINSNYDKGVM